MIVTDDNIRIERFISWLLTASVPMFRRSGPELELPRQTAIAAVTVGILIRILSDTRGRFTQYRYWPGQTSSSSRPGIATAAPPTSLSGFISLPRHCQSLQCRTVTHCSQQDQAYTSEPIQSQTIYQPRSHLIYNIFSINSVLCLQLVQRGCLQVKRGLQLQSIRNINVCCLLWYYLVNDIISTPVP